MVLETAKNKICMHQIVEKLQDEIIAEGDMIVNDVKPDILGIISTNGIVCVYKKEIMDGKIRIDGTINTYIIYLANDENGNTRTLNTVLDFTYVTDSKNCKEQMTFDENISLSKIECKILNERKINIKAILNISGILYSDEEIEIVSNIENMEDIQVLNTSKKINSLMGKAKTKVYAKDTMKIKEENTLAEIMRVNTTITNQSMKISYNKVLAKSDLSVNIMYLTEDNRICTQNMIIPVMGFVDMENVGENNKCNIDYKIKNIIIKPNTNEENSIYIEVEIEITCLAYEQKEISLIEDMYSIYSNLSFDQSKVDAICEKENLIDICNVTKQISVPELENSKVYNIEAVSQINAVTLRNSKILYEGVINLEILYNGVNGVESKIIEEPFEFQVRSDVISESDDVKTILSIQKNNTDISGGNINLDLGIEFAITIFNKESLNVISNIEVEELRDQNIYSMVIYFVKSGDTLWKIAKKFKSTIEDIARVNGIEDVNKLDIGQQLYIPKYVKKNIA